MALLMAAGFTSCVNYKSRGEKRVTLNSKRTTGDFNKVANFTSCLVSYEQGDSCSVRVIGDKQLVKSIVTRVVNGELQITRKPFEGDWERMIHGGDFMVYVTSPDLLEVRMDGSGDFMAAHKIDTDTLRVSLLGSGKLTINDLICDAVDATLRGSGDLKMQQVETVYANLNLIGSGNMAVRLKNAKQTNTALTGSGDLMVGFDNCKRVDCKLLGSGDVVLRGHVEQLNRESTGSGDIITSKLSVASSRAGKQ